MSDTAPAWLLSVAENIQLCIGEHEAAEYIENPQLQYIPMTPDFCKNIIFWNDMIVPLIDINILYGNPAATGYQHVIVIAYQEKEGMPLGYVAFVLASPPDKIIVNDDDACELPEDYPETLSPYVLSLFSHNNQVVSILDIARLSTVLPEQYTP